MWRVLGAGVEPPYDWGLDSPLPQDNGRNRRLLIVGRWTVTSNLRSVLGRTRQAAHATRHEIDDPPEAHMATDPVCGMTVDPHAGKPSLRP